ncbi:MAG TPA: hypothetical protein VJU14_11310 [Solirubrobacterales bacterium]|nr:hypothetical protein [Solirubrobacterales bacterium]
MGRWSSASPAASTPAAGHKVAAVPHGGGKLEVLAKNALEPDWSR